MTRYHNKILIFLKDHLKCSVHGVLNSSFDCVVFLQSEIYGSNLSLTDSVTPPVITPPPTPVNRFLESVSSHKRNQIHVCIPRYILRGLGRDSYHVFEVKVSVLTDSLSSSAVSSESNDLAHFLMQRPFHCFFPIVASFWSRYVGELNNQPSNVIFRGLRKPYGREKQARLIACRLCSKRVPCLKNLKTFFSDWSLTKASDLFYKQKNINLLKTIHSTSKQAKILFLKRAI